MLILHRIYDYTTPRLSGACQYSKALCGLLFAIFTFDAALADESTWYQQHTLDSLFIPDTYYLHNPLRSDEKSKRVNLGTSSFGMDDDDLIRAVANMQDTSMNTSQRLLNYQWLSAAEDNGQLKHGGQALSKIFMTGLKTFWDDHYGEKFYKGTIMKDSTGVFQPEMDYRIRVNDNSLKMSLEYNF